MEDGLKEILDLREEYITVHKKTLESQKEESEKLNTLRKNCPHPSRYIAEVDYQPSTAFFNALPEVFFALGFWRFPGPGLPHDR